jgi:hypothetical protein
MQAIKDAGIVVVVILLAVSVRFTPLEETGQELGVASLTPQTEAAPATPPIDPVQIDWGVSAAPANATFVATPDQISIRRLVLRDSDEIAHVAEIDTSAVEHCSEVLFQIRKAAERTRNEAIVLEAEEVVKVLACSA